VRKVIAEAAEGKEHLLIVDIDLSLVRRRRQEIPLVREGRLGLLRREIDRASITSSPSSATASPANRPPLIARR
jgi:hypothetical protein